MIANLRGNILMKRDNWFIVDTGGVGYKVFAPSSVIDNTRVGDTGSFYIYHNITESSQALYGFQVYEEQEFFELLLSISGIGPKVALSVLSAASMGDIREAVISGNADILTNISGIGKKTADRIVLELKNKIKIGDVRPIGTKSTDVGSSANLDVYEALTQLGYNSVEARAAIKMIPDSIKDADKRLKEALKNLGR